MKVGSRVLMEKNNRFDDFFREPLYLHLKNHLYSYQVRKRAVRELLQSGEQGLTLEIGSGISAISPATERTVYTELSYPALRCLKELQGGEQYVVADATRLPFKEGVFQRIVCSEVLEHIENDLVAVAEMAAVLRKGGRLIVTFPHRKDFFAADDRYVGHHRRYELKDMLGLLETSGLRPLSVAKVLGPLEKITMWSVVPLLSLSLFAGQTSARTGRRLRLPSGLLKAFEVLNRLYAGLARLDARVAPMRLAMVLVAESEKT